MTIDQFLDDMKADLECWANHYREMMQREPAEWPSELNSGEWSEQFDAWSALY